MLPNRTDGSNLPIAAAIKYVRFLPRCLVSSEVLLAAYMSNFHATFTDTVVLMPSLVVNRKMSSIKSYKSYKTLFVLESPLLHPFCIHATGTPITRSDPQPCKRSLNSICKKNPKKKLHPDLRCLRALATRSTMKNTSSWSSPHAIISPVQTQKGRPNLLVDLDLGFASSLS